MLTKYKSTTKYIDGVEEEGLICIFGQKDVSDLWKNGKIQKGLTASVLGPNCFYDYEKWPYDFHNEIFDPILENISYYLAIKMMGA